MAEAAGFRFFVVPLSIPNPSVLFLGIIFSYTSIIS